MAFQKKDVNIVQDTRTTAQMDSNKATKEELVSKLVFYACDAREYTKEGGAYYDDLAKTLTSAAQRIARNE
jgi:hypothetical protein